MEQTLLEVDRVAFIVEVALEELAGALVAGGYPQQQKNRNNAFRSHSRIGSTRNKAAPHVCGCVQWAALRKTPDKQYAVSFWNGSNLKDAFYYDWCMMEEVTALINHVVDSFCFPTNQPTKQPSSESWRRELCERHKRQLVVSSVLCGLWRRSWIRSR